MADIINTSHERDLVATDAIIRNARSGTFRNIAIGVGAGGALLLAGAAAVVLRIEAGQRSGSAQGGAEKHTAAGHHGEDRPGEQGPPRRRRQGRTGRRRQVALEPGAKVTVRGTAKQDTPPVLPKPPKDDADPAIQTTVTVFKTVKYGARRDCHRLELRQRRGQEPFEQYCYFNVGSWHIREARAQNVGYIGKMADIAGGVRRPPQRFSLCQWFNGGL